MKLQTLNILNQVKQKASAKKAFPDFPVNLLYLRLWRFAKLQELSQSCANFHHGKLIGDLNYPLLLLMVSKYDVRST